MIFIFAISLIFIAQVLLFLKKTRFVIALMNVFIIAVFAVGSGMVPSALLDGLQTHRFLKGFDWKAGRTAIVLLGGGTVRGPSGDDIHSNIAAHSRIHEAARLYYECKTVTEDCHILPSGGDPLKNGASEAEVMSRELQEIGVSADDILLEPKSNNTFQNAQFTSEILRDQHFDHTLLVTSGFHLKRALTYFEHFGIIAIPAPADQLNAVRSIKPLGYNFLLADIALHEYVGLVQYKIYNLLGRNPVITKPGEP